MPLMEGDDLWYGPRFRRKQNPRCKEDRNEHGKDGTATRSVRAIDSRRFATLDRYIRFCERSVSVDMLLDEARLRQNRNQSTQINR